MVRILKKPILPFLKSSPSNLSNCKILPKYKNVSIYCLNVSIQLRPKIIYLGIYGLEFFRKLLYLKSAVSNLSNCNILYKRKKYLNLAPKICHLSVFGLEFSKNYFFIFEISNNFLICLIGQFCLNRKSSRFGAKNTLF